PGAYPGHTRGLARRLQRPSTTLPARLDEPIQLRRTAAARCAALHRRLRAADRRHHPPTGHCQLPDSNSDWIRIGGNVTSYQPARSNMSVEHPPISNIDV